MSYVHNNNHLPGNFFFSGGDYQIPVFSLNLLLLGHGLCSIAYAILTEFALCYRRH